MRLLYSSRLNGTRKARELEITGVTLEGGKVTISALAYADDVALTCDTKPEASGVVSAIRLGFRKDGDKD